MANNLANVSTTGFKAQLSAFRAVPVVGPGLCRRAPSRSDSTLGTDLTPGPLMPTGRPLDVAVKGKGWIAVRGADGSEAYTRDGGLQVSANGLLQTRSGLTVLGDGGPITVPPNSTVTIGGDGTVSVIPTDGVPNAVSIVGRIKLVNPPAAESGTRQRRPVPADERPAGAGRRATCSSPPARSKAAT